jgi:hypothetical protein
VRVNKAALTKHEIYNKLFGFTEHDLDAVANYYQRSCDPGFQVC